MPEPTKPQIQTPPPNSPGKDKADEVYKQEFGGAKTEGQQAVEFLDSQRQDVAQDTSKNQEEDLKKSLGTGFTFGALNVANSAPPEVYLNRAEDYKSSDEILDTARKFTSNQLTVPGSAARRFAKPLAIGSATMYAGSRAVDSLLDEERQVNYSKNENMSNKRPTGMGPKGFSSDNSQLQKGAAKSNWLEGMADFFRKSDTGGPTQNSSAYENAPHLDDTKESYDNVPHPDDPYFDEAVDQAESQMGQPRLEDIEQIRRGIEEQNRGFFDRLSDGFEKSKDQASEAGKTITGIGGAGLAGGAGYLGYNAYMDNGPKSTGEEVAYNISNKPSTRVGRQVASSPSGVRSQRPQLDRRRTKQAEKKIEKKADDESILDFNEKQENYGLMAGGSAVGGAGASMLDPRTTLYHGTSPYNKEKIQSEGFKSNLNENNALDDVDRTFLTPRPYKNDIARSWEAKNSPPGASRGDGLVKSRIPLWKRDYITNNKLWKSPTMTRLPDDIEEKVKKIAPSPRIGIEGDISPEYVKGQNYSGPNMSEFSEYIKETPKGKAGAGAALLGGGLAAYGLSEEADRRTKEAASEDGFSTEEKDMAQDISVGVAGAGAASGLVGSYGPDAIRGSNPLSQEGIDRFKDFADNSPYDKSSREFMQEYARSGSKLLGNELIDTPVGSATGAEAVESLKNIDKQKRTQMLGRAGNMFADPDSADDPRLSHYTEFGKGQLPALAQMHADSSELADNGPISDPIEDFKSDVVGAQEAAKEKLDGTSERNPEEYKRLMTSEMEDSFGRADQSDVRGLVDNIVNSDASSIEEEIPGKDEAGRSVHDVSKQNFVRQAQDLGYDVSSFEDIEKMSPNVQREIMESNATGDVWQNWATLKGNRSFRPKPRTYRNSVVPALQEMSDRFDNAASRFGKNVSPAMIRGGAGLAAAGAAGAGAIEYMGEDKTGANKIAGGPGSGVEHDNTDEITRLEKSPKITIHRREKIKAQRDPDRKKEIQISSIDYAAQSKYNIEKLSWFLKNWPEWKDSRIDVALMDGEYHLMDGHHRYLAADRLQKESLPANVWIVSEDEVDQIVKSAKKDHSFNVGDTFYSKANNEHIEIVSMSGQMATVSSEGNSWKEPVDVMKYKTQNGHWKQMSEKKASVSALGQPVLYKNAKGEEEDMETGTKALYAGAGTVGAGGGYNAARAIGKGIRVNNAQSKYLNRVQETDNNLAKPSAEELGRNENFYGQVKNAPGREAGNSLIRPSMNLLSNKPGSDIVIESGGSGDVVAPTFMHELGHYKNFEESNYNQFGEYIGEKDLKGKDSGIVSDLMGSNEKSPLLQEEEKAWSKARDIAERNNMSGSMDAPTRRFALDTYKNLQELGRYGRNTGRLLPLAIGLGVAGNAARENGWFNDNKKEASLSTLGQSNLQKKAKKDYKIETSSPAADFAAGIDPFGSWTTPQAMKNEMSGMSESDHKKRQAINIAGGVVGGGVVVPSVTSGIVGAGREAASSSSAREALLNAGAGFAQGVTKPIRGVTKSQGIISKLDDVASSSKSQVGVSDALKQDIKWSVGNMPVKSLYDEGAKFQESLDQFAKGLNGDSKGTPNVDLSGMNQDVRDAYNLKFNNTIRPDKAKEVLDTTRSVRNRALTHLGVGAGVGGLGAGLQYEQGKDLAGYSKSNSDDKTAQLNKESARRLSDLERDGDWVKYRGEWYPLDKPVESWRKGKKRAVLASKKEGGEKKVKMVHYGSSDHEHNYSDKAKKNYLSRAKGITNQNGEKTKDDPHSANHWAIKDLWPEDQKADGSEKFDAHTPDDDSRFMSDKTGADERSVEMDRKSINEKTGSSNSRIIVDRENPGRAHRIFAQSDSEPIDDKEEYKSRASEAFEREYGTQPENVKTETYHGSGSAMASRTDPISSLPEDQQRKAISGYKSDVYTDRGLPGGMMIGGIAGGLAPLGGGKTRVATSMLGSMLGGAAGAEISRSMAPSPQDVDVDEYLRRHDRSSISKESEDKNNRFSRTINMVGRFPKSANDTSLPDGIDAPETEVNFDTGEIGENMSFDMDMPDIEMPDDASVDMPEPAYTVTPGTDPNEADENPVSADLQNVKQNPA